MGKLYTVSKNKTRSWLWLRSWAPYCQIQTESEVGKTTRPFRYDLNQIPYDYTVEVTKRLKGLDLIDKSAWWTMDRASWHCIGDKDEDHPKEKEMQKGKMAVWRGLINSCEKRRSEKQRRKGKIFPFDCRVPKNSKEREESLLQWSVQRYRGKQQNGKD